MLWEGIPIDEQDSIGYRLVHEDMRELLKKVDGVLLHKQDSPYRGVL